MPCREPALWGKTHAERCEQHKLTDDVNFVERRCGSCGLLWRLSPKGLCSQCSEGALQRLAKQRAVRDILNARLPEHPYTTYDRITPALRRLGDLERPDFYWDCDGYAAILEVDERQPDGRPEACECARMVNICQAERRPTYFLRYNPDAFRSGDGVVWKKTRRVNLLLRTLQTLLTRRPAEGPLAIKRLFFNGFVESHAAIWTSIEQL